MTQENTQSPVAEAISANPKISPAELSEQLGISLEDATLALNSFSDIAEDAILTDKIIIDPVAEIG